MMRGYKPVEIEITINGRRRTLRVQVDEETTKDTMAAFDILYKLFNRLREDMLIEGIF